MQMHLSKISIFHSLNDNSNFKVDDFSSLRFIKLYVYSLLPPTSRVNAFEIIDVHDKLEDCIVAMIDHVNSADRYMIIGC